MTDPEYYERTAAEFSQRHGVKVAAWMVQRTEEVTGKPWGEQTPEDLEHVDTVVQAEHAVYRAAQEQAIEWSRTIRMAMEKRGAETTQDLYDLLVVADDPDAAGELATLRSLNRFLAAENDTKGAP